MGGWRWAAEEIGEGERRVEGDSKCKGLKRERGEDRNEWKDGTR